MFKRRTKTAATRKGFAHSTRVCRPDKQLANSAQAADVLAAWGEGHLHDWASVERPLKELPGLTARSEVSREFTCALARRHRLGTGEVGKLVQRCHGGLGIVVHAAKGRSVEENKAAPFQCEAARAHARQANDVQRRRNAPTIASM